MSTMYLEVTCNKCKNRIRMLFGQTDSYLRQCPTCHEEISFEDAEQLCIFGERVNTITDRLKDVTINGIYTGNAKHASTSNTFTNLFHEDINRLVSIFDHSDADVRACIESAVDTLYLLINRDAEDADLQRLNETNSKLHALFLDKVDEQHKDMRQ